MTDARDWQEISRRRAYDGYSKIDIVDYRQPDGEVRPYDILVGPDTVCVVALTEDGKVILASQYRPGPAKQLLELPGGYIDDGEDPVVAGARELLEETGYAVDTKLVAQSYLMGGATRRRYCCVVTKCRRVGEQELESSEFVDIQLLTLDEFRALLRSGQMTDVDMGYLGLDHLGLL